MTTTALFKHIKTGQIFQMVIGTTHITFAKLHNPVAPVNPDLVCDNCGKGVWNATNFGNNVHFCPQTTVIPTSFFIKRDV